MRLIICFGLLFSGCGAAASFEFRPHSVRQHYARVAQQAVVFFEGDTHVLESAGAVYLGLIEGEGVAGLGREGLRREVGVEAARHGGTHILPGVEGDNPIVVQWTPDRVVVESVAGGAVASAVPGVRTTHEAPHGIFHVVRVEPTEWANLGPELTPPAWPNPTLEWTRCTTGVIVNVYSRLRVFSPGSEYAVTDDEIIIIRRDRGRETRLPANRNSRRTLRCRGPADQGGQ